jgi:hypothetical protein
MHIMEPSREPMIDAYAPSLDSIATVAITGTVSRARRDSRHDAHERAVRLVRDPDVR